MKIFLSKTKIIDLSADFRIKDVIRSMRTGTKLSIRAPQFIDEAVYGLCEINREKIKDARLIANPGCYTDLLYSDCLSAGKGRHH